MRYSASAGFVPSSRRALAWPESPPPAPLGPHLRTPERNATRANAGDVGADDGRVPLPLQPRYEKSRFSASERAFANHNRPNCHGPIGKPSTDAFLLTQNRRDTISNCIAAQAVGLIVNRGETDKWISPNSKRWPERTLMQ